MLDNKIFIDCVEDGEGIVSVASVNSEGNPHIANTWNSYLIIKDNQILIPCFGFTKTEKNIKANPYVEVVIGSAKVQGKMGMGTGFLLTGKARIEAEGDLFDEMKAKKDFANRVLIVEVESLKQTI